MNRALARCIIRSLRLTDSRKEFMARLGGFRQSDWERTLSWLDDSGLALYLLKQVDRHGINDTLPGAIRARLQRNLTSNRQRVAAMQHEFEFLNRRFESAGVVFVALKGFALIPEFCPDASLRLQYDYDYLVRSDCEDVARQVLQSGGYSPKVQSPGHEPEGQTLFASDPLGLPSADQDFYLATLARRVELHSGLWEPHGEGMQPGIPRDFMERRQFREFQGIHFAALADDDALLFQVLHAFKHLLAGWCRMSCFYEIAYFMTQRHSDASFWDRFRTRVEMFSYLPEITGLVFSMGNFLFGAPLPDKVATWSVRSPILRLWVQEYGERWAFAPFPGSKLSLFVHGEFVRDSRRWKRVRRTRLLPLHRPAHVTEAAREDAGSRWKAKWDQWRFVVRRVKFHIRALLSYAWHLPHWCRIRRQALNDVRGNDG